jgi:putative FmdB family regulatory protein
VPIYEFRCPKGHLFEVFQRMTEPGPTECEVCGASPVTRVFHAVPVHFKGSGFYSTDYGRGSRKPDKDEGAPKTDEGATKKKEEKKKPAEAS